MNTTDFHRNVERKAVTVVGAGILGSHLLPQLGRMAEVGRVTIVDHDSYEEKNLASQAISPADVGHAKATRQAWRLRECAPHLRVTPLVGRVEEMPWGALRADVIAGCLDSRLARREVSGIAWRLGVPFVDAGVQADGMLARVQVYRPDSSGACLECAWDQRDYDAERESFACDGSRREAAPTNAPSSLGALAAAMQAIEIGKILRGEWEHVAVGREVLLDAKSHRHFVTRLPRRAGCRFDHRTLDVQTFRGTPERLTLAELFAPGVEALRVQGQTFARQWACAPCGPARERFGLRDRIAGSTSCPQCGGALRAVGFHARDRLAAAEVPDGLRAVPLSRFGFREGDIFTAESNGAETHYEITATPEAQP